MYQQAATTRGQAQTICLGRLATVLLFAVTAAGLAGCDEKDPTGTELTTSTEGAQATASDADGDSSAARAAGSVAALGTIGLPINQSKASAGVLFGLTQTGTGQGGSFRINNTSNSKDALLGRSNGRGGAAVHGLATGEAAFAGFFESTNPNNGNAALLVRTGHIGPAGFFQNLNPNNGAAALDVETEGPGLAVLAIAKGGSAGLFQSSSTDATLLANNFASGFAARFRGFGQGKGVLIETQGGAGLQVVGGSKNAVVHTPSGAKALYTEESTEVWFTDYGFGKLENGRVRVRLDPSFAQTINPDEPYHVFVQPYGGADLSVADRTPLGFTVALKEGDQNAEFSYRIVAKRLGFEAKRLEPAPWADQLASAPGAR